MSETPVASGQMGNGRLIASVQIAGTIIALLLQSMFIVGSLSGRLVRVETQLEMASQDLKDLEYRLRQMEVSRVAGPAK